VNYYSDEEEHIAREIVWDIEQSGDVSAIAVQADVGSEDDVRRMVRETVEAFGGGDVSVTNAGIEKQGPLLETSMNGWESTPCGPTSPGPSCPSGRSAGRWWTPGAVSW
jgi:glucose 1-dehydrogenase